MDAVFVQGMIATVFSFAVFVGTIWLVMAMVLGARMGYLVMASIFFGIMVILSGMWFLNGLGPKGPETTWVAIGVGDDLSEVEGFGITYDVSDYPHGEWEPPAAGRRLADLRPERKPCVSVISESLLGKKCGGQDTLSESSNAGPVMTTLVSEAINPIPGIRDRVADEVHGAVSIQGTDFAVVDLRMKEAVVDGKPSLIAMGRAVPSESLIAETLGAGVEEALVTRYLVEVGEKVRAGQPVVETKADSKILTVAASSSGTIISLSLREGDKVKAGVPIAALDLSGQPGQPSDAEVTAVRLRGAVRTPAFFYLAGSLVLFAIHMAALSRAERAKKPVAVTA